MTTFKEYLAEAKYPDPTPIRDVTMAELLKLLTKGQMNSVKKNKLVQAIAGMDQTYEYGVSNAGFVQLIITAGYSRDGKPNPTRMVQLQLDPRKVTMADMFFKAEGTNTWKHLT